jgi:hypothetical protein
LYVSDAGLAVIGAVWLTMIGVSYVTHRALLPSRFAEGGWLLKTLRLASRVGEVFGVQRDWTDNAAIAVYNRLAWAREWRVRANEVLILIPRCLSRTALEGVMDIAKRYDVATFVATRGAIGFADRVESAQVDDDAVAYRATRHATARRARHERDVHVVCPAYESHDVVGVGRDRHRLRHNAADAGRLGVHGARGDVVAKDALEIGAWPVNAVRHRIMVHILRTMTSVAPADKRRWRR